MQKHIILLTIVLAITAMTLTSAQVSSSSSSSSSPVSSSSSPVSSSSSPISSSSSSVSSSSSSSLGSTSSSIGSTSSSVGSTSSVVSSTSSSFSSSSPILSSSSITNTTSNSTAFNGTWSFCYKMISNGNDGTVGSWGVVGYGFINTTYPATNLTTGRSGYLVKSIQGIRQQTLNGVVTYSNITGIISAGSYQANDNYLYTNNSVFDNLGLAFQVSPAVVLPGTNSSTTQLVLVSSGANSLTEYLSRTPLSANFTVTPYYGGSLPNCTLYVPLNYTTSSSSSSSTGIASNTSSSSSTGVIIGSSSSSINSNTSGNGSYTGSSIYTSLPSNGSSSINSNSSQSSSSSSSHYVTSSYYYYNNSDNQPNGSLPVVSYICPTYATLNGVSQTYLMTAIISRAVLGSNDTETNVTVQGIVGSDANGNPSPLLNFFNGVIQYRNWSYGVSPNFFANGGNNTDFTSLFSHLVSYFGGAFGCNQDFALGLGNQNMFQVHQDMFINGAQFDFFNRQILLTLESFGVANADVQAVESFLGEFARCAPNIGGYPAQICWDPNTCEIAGPATGNCNSNVYTNEPQPGNPNLSSSASQSYQLTSASVFLTIFVALFSLLL